MPGAELEIAITTLARRQLPSGDLVLLSSWPNTKDKLAGGVA